MSDLFFIAAFVVFAICIVMHILPAFFKLGRLFGYINVFLHSVMLVFALLGGLSLKLVLLLYMASVCVFSAVAFITSGRERDNDV